MTGDHMLASHRGKGLIRHLAAPPDEYPARGRKQPHAALGLQVPHMPQVIQIGGEQRSTRPAEAAFLRIPTKPDSDSENNPDGIPIVKPDSFAGKVRSYLGTDQDQTGRIRTVRAATRGKHGRNRPETICFLGFALYCTRNQKGNFKVGMRTEETRLRRNRPPSTAAGLRRWQVWSVGALRRQSRALPIPRQEIVDFVGVIIARKGKLGPTLVRAHASGKG